MNPPISQKLLFNQPARKTLDALFSGGRVPHAILLEGPEGCGKTVCAKELAARILCAGENPPCGSCLSCRKAAQDSHPDILVVEKESGKQQFSVELVRKVRENAYIMPNESRYKVFIIRNAHEMNSNAQNALLKILEEPPAHCVFVLTAVSRARLLATILSRVTPVLLSHPTQQECLEALPALVPDKTDEDYRRAAQLSGGSLSAAVRLLTDEEGLTAWRDARALAETVIGGSEYALLTLLAPLEKNREHLLAVLGNARGIFAELLLCKKGKALQDEQLTALAAKITPLQAVSFVDIIEWAQDMSRQNVSAAVLLSGLCARLKSVAQA